MRRLFQLVRAWLSGRIRQFLVFCGIRSRVTTLNGFPVRLPLSWITLKECVSPNFAVSYERHCADELLNRIRPGDIVYDVGAFKGFYTLMFAGKVGASGRVLSFEPNPYTCDSLAKVVALNRLDKVTIVHAALGQSEGTGTLGLSASSSSMVDYRDFRGYHEVRTTTLDSVASERAAWPDVIKIDVEGYEYMVVQGGAESLGRARLLFVEIHPRMMAALGCEVSALTESLVQYGFKEVFRDQEDSSDAAYRVMYEK
jgi:FkbM family methyltransferase